MSKKNKKGSTSAGRARARRPRTGAHKRMAIRLSQEEKIKIERAASKAGVSMVRFIVERTLAEAERILSEPK